MNVLPSAPEYEGHTSQLLYPMGEIAQLNAEDFRLKKINDLLKELSDEVEHYRQVAKKYKRSHTMVHTSAVGLGSLSVGLSSGAFATALTGFGIVASPALAGVATLCGLASVGFAATSKRLERKVTKHEKIFTLALAKCNSVNELVSQALADKQISDIEFRIITREVEKYHELKGRYTRGSLLPQHAPATCSRSKAPSSAPTISSEKICCATKLLLPSFAPSYQTGLI